MTSQYPDDYRSRGRVCARCGALRNPLDGCYCDDFADETSVEDDDDFGKIDDAFEDLEDLESEKRRNRW
jgi:hypothetical protein